MIDAIVDSRAQQPTIFHADFVDDENRNEETMVSPGCMVYPTIQQALDAGRHCIFVRGGQPEQRIDLPEGDDAA